MPSTIFVIAYAELAIARSCSLACDGCAVFSNYGIKRNIPLEEGGAWLRSWGQRVRPKVFRLLGGEPLLNPDLFGYVRLTRELWPDADLGVVTNGTLLERVPDLPVVLNETGTRLHISLHSDEPGYVETITRNIKVLRAWIERWGADWLEINDHRVFKRYYRGLGANIKPFTDGNPVASWQNCFARTCLNIFDNRLWKCPQVLFIKDMAAKYALSENPEWQPYLNYKGVGFEASDQELHAFLTRTVEPECAMCPVHPPEFVKDVSNRDFDRPELEMMTYDGPREDLFRAFLDNGIYVHRLMEPQTSPICLIR